MGGASQGGTEPGWAERMLGEARAGDLGGAADPGREDRGSASGARCPGARAGARRELEARKGGRTLRGPQPRAKQLPRGLEPPSPGAMTSELLGFCNWSTLGVCAALKLPQISALLAARSARGLSLPSLLLELAG